jgi:threonine/homoserine/homoserine lactone efflux protein
MDWLHGIRTVLGETLRDVLPIVLVIFGAQLLILRQRIPHLRRVLVGFVYVILGMALFLLGLEQALFPIGKLMATQLTDPRFIYSLRRSVSPLRSPSRR